MSELKVDVKQLIKDWNDCPEDDGFDSDHPIFLMAQDVDDLRLRNAELKNKNDALVARVASLKLHRDILADHMAEVKAISDGCNKNTLQDVVSHCLYELENKIPKINDVDAVYDD